MLIGIFTGLCFQLVEDKNFIHLEILRKSAIPHTQQTITVPYFFCWRTLTMKYLGEMKDLTLVGFLAQVGVNARSLASSCCIYESCVPQLEADLMLVRSFSSKNILRST